MSTEPDPREVPSPADRPGEPRANPLRILGETQHVLTSSQIAPDPERIAQGWERRFIADEARVAEMIRLYQDLGYETAADPIRPADVDEDCGDCGWVPLRLKVIYTRRRPESHGT